MTKTPRQVENMGRTIVLLREELEVAQARIAELQAAYAAEQAKATRLERAALPQPVSDYLAALRETVGEIAGCGDIRFSHDINSAQAEHEAALDCVEAEIARLEREVRQQDVLIQRWMTEAEDKQTKIARLAEDGAALEPSGTCGPGCWPGHDCDVTSPTEDGAADADSTGDLDADLQAQGFDPFGSGGAA